MTKLHCNDCGSDFDASMSACPTCGCPKGECVEISEPKAEQEAAAKSGEQANVSATAQAPAPVTKPSAVGKSDWANYIFECGAMFWNTFSKKYCSFSGRATRREFWSFFLVGIPLYSGIWMLVLLLPLLAVAVRRMHDINKSGWWILVPYVSLFLFLKKSDEGVNDYGGPSEK